MIYSKFFVRSDPKIPTVFSLVFLLLIILILARFFSSTPIPSKASKYQVKNMRVVNPYHNQVGIFWQTEEKETGWVIFGEDEKTLDKIALDERDIQDKRSKYYNHLAFLKNLKPETQYYYKLVSDNQIVASADDTPFTFKTLANLVLTSNLNPAYGKIIRENGEPLQEGIVLLYFEKSYPMAAISKATGEWLIPLNTIIAKDSFKSMSIGTDEKVNIEVYANDKKQSKIITNLSNLSPLPQTVIIGKNYNFLKLDNVLAVTTGVGFKSTKIEILFPKEDAIISGGNPLIKGTGVEGNVVTVTIESTQALSLKTTVDKEGVWRIVLPKTLTPGSHVLKVTTYDKDGKEVKLLRNFVVAKSGEQVLGEATEEATPTIIPTEILAPSNTPIPTVEMIQTSTSSITLVPGGNVAPFGMISASLIILGLGVLLAF